MQVEERRLDLVEESGADVEESGSSGPAQELAPGCGEHVAADALHVDRELSDRLAGVEQEGDAGLAGGGADLFGWVDETTLGGHVCDGDQLHRAPVVGEASQ